MKISNRAVRLPLRRQGLSDLSQVFIEYFDILHESDRAQDEACQTALASMARLLRAGSISMLCLSDKAPLLERIGFKIKRVVHDASQANATSRSIAICDRRLLEKWIRRGLLEEWMDTDCDPDAAPHAKKLAKDNALARFVEADRHRFEAVP
jgi:hypothetical protein